MNQRSNGFLRKRPRCHRCGFQPATSSHLRNTIRWVAVTVVCVASPATEVIAVPGTAAPDENTLKKVQVRINDRGPYAPGRIIDLSTAAFQKLAPLGSGILNVCIYTLQ